MESNCVMRDSILPVIVHSNQYSIFYSNSSSDLKPDRKLVWEKGDTEPLLIKNSAGKSHKTHNTLNTPEPQLQFLTMICLKNGTIMVPKENKAEE